MNTSSCCIGVYYRDFPAGFALIQVEVSKSISNRKCFFLRGDGAAASGVNGRSSSKMDEIDYEQALKIHNNTNKEYKRPEVE